MERRAAAEAEGVIINSNFHIATDFKWHDRLAMDLLAEGIVLCPYCGETYSTMVDTSQSSHATIEDCPVCCRPIQLTVECEPGEVFSIDAVPG